MAATVAKAWQQVQQKILPPPLPPPRTPLTHSALNTKAAAKQQNPFNHVDENKKRHDGTEKKQFNPCNHVDNKKTQKKQCHHVYRTNEELARYQLTNSSIRFITLLKEIINIRNIKLQGKDFFIYKQVEFK